MRIIFVGEKPTPSAPTLTWAKALKRVGADYIFINPSTINTKAWINQVLQYDAIIIQSYGHISQYDMRQLSIAVFLGCPIIRKWSGSDVYYALKDLKLSKSVSKFNRLVSLNLTSEHNGLVDELLSLGIKCTLTNQVISELPSKKKVYNNKESILVYLPDSKYDFYGFKFIKQAIINFPEAHFIIIADKKHALNNFKNVTSLGWVDDMDSVWNKIGLLIRITEHDGFPRSIVEAFSRGVYVIHNRNCPGVCLANTQEEIDECIAQFLTKNEINYEGMNYIKDTTNGNSDKDLFHIIKHTGNKVFQQIYALFNSIYITLKLKSGLR